MRGTWSVKHHGATAVLEVQEFARVPKAARDNLVEEGLSLLRFAVDGEQHDVSFVAAE